MACFPVPFKAVLIKKAIFRDISERNNYYSDTLEVSEGGHVFRFEGPYIYIYEVTIQVAVLIRFS